MIIQPGASVPATFGDIGESSDQRWSPVLGASSIDLVGEGFNAGRNTTGVYLDTYYTGLEDEDISARKAFMEQYLNWPIHVGNVDSGEIWCGFLHAVRQNESEHESFNFGHLQIYVRNSGNYNGDSSDDIADAPLNWTYLRALKQLFHKDDGTAFPMSGEYPTVSYPKASVSTSRIIKVTEHSIEPAVRSEDDPQTILINSTENIEGIVPISGATPITVGAVVTIDSRDFTLERISRKSAVELEVRLERIIT